PSPAAESREDVALLRPEDGQLARLRDDDRVADQPALPEQLLRAEPAAGLLVGHQVDDDRAAPARALGGEPAESDEKAGDPSLHAARAAPVQPPARELASERVARPPLADRHRVEVPREHERATARGAGERRDDQRPLRGDAELLELEAGDLLEVRPRHGG